MFASALRKEKKVINFYYKDPSAIECIVHILFIAGKVLFFLSMDNSKTQCSAAETHYEYPSEELNNAH